jgi:hypothetical protein
VQPDGGVLDEERQRLPIPGHRLQVGTDGEVPAAGVDQHCPHAAVLVALGGDPAQGGAEAQVEGVGSIRLREGDVGDTVGDVEFDRLSHARPPSAGR